MTGWFEWIKQSDDPCLVALHGDDAETLGKQLAAGRSVDERFHAGRTFLHIAAELGATRCAKALLEAGADLEAKMEFGGDSPLMQAVGFGKTETTRYLLMKGARIRYSWTPQDSPEIRSEKEKEFTRLAAETHQKLQSSLPFDIGDSTNEMARSMLEAHLRTREVYALDLCHDLPTLRLLVEEHGCDPNRHDGGGYWPLKAFAEKGDAAAIEYLVKHGADPNFTSTGDTALHAAVAANSAECVRILLEAGANPNQQDVDGWVAMFHAGSHEVLDLLLQFGADPNTEDQCGQKPSSWVKDSGLKDRLLRLEKKDTSTEG